MTREPLAQRTHCRRGHALTPENVWVTPSTGAWRCRKCLKINAEALARRRKRARLAATGIPMTGDNYVLDDLDVAILAALPDEGAKLGKYLPDSRTSVQLQKELDDPEFLTAHTLGRRLSALQEAGYVKATTNRSAKMAKGWQRTKKGKDIVV